MKWSWELIRNRSRLQNATVYPSHFGHTTDGTIWSKAFVCGLADVYPPKTSSDLRHLIVSMRHYLREIEISEEPITPVYVVGSRLREFAEDVFPKVTRKIALITGDADDSVPTSALGSMEAAERFLDDQRLAGAWMQNLDIQHPKAFPLPIGLDFHSLHINKAGPWHRHEEGLEPNTQESQVQRIANQAPPFNQRELKVFTHFTVETQPAVRSEWLEYLKTQSFSEAPVGTIERPTLWRNMANTQFVASPPGGGMDCHRTWEALVLGSAPIVQHFPPMTQMFEDLPVWQVKCVSEVTPENLRRKANEISRKIQEDQYDFKKLTVGWWKDFLNRQVADQ